MSNGKHEGEEDYLSPRDMRQWGEQELKDIAKASELRQREINELVTAYENGKLTPEKADELQWKYQHRWGEALRGTSATEGVTDEQILTKIDSTRRPFVSPGQRREQARKSGRDPDQDVPSR